LELLLLL